MAQWLAKQRCQRDPPITETRNAAPENAGELEISGLTVTGHVDAINLNIRPGECVGLAGLAGSGKDHVAEVVAGLLYPTSGEVSIDGVRAPTGNVEAMRAAGVGFVPRDRHHRAIFPLLSVAENLTITVLDRFGALRPCVAFASDIDGSTEDP